LGQYAGIAGGLLGGSKSWAETVSSFQKFHFNSTLQVQSLVQGGLGNFFKIFGGLAASSQAAIGGLIAQSLEVFTTVMKCN
jgi:hypothetical protein